MQKIDATNAWKSLFAHRNKTASTSISDLFSQDADRFDNFSWRHQGLLLDLSKNRIDQAALDGLISLARAADIESARNAMFAGEPINLTENRRVLHVALRDRNNTSDQRVARDVAKIKQRLATYTTSVRDRRIRGITGRPFSDVISIGIGGSHLGPLLTTQALASKTGPTIHFVANLDGHELAPKLACLNPETTLILVASKSFATQETLTNAKTVVGWLTDTLGQKAFSTHIVAITARPDAANAFGILEPNIFPMWDWVGGRFSLWSAVGLSAALAIGWPSFSSLLDGANEMDRHFHTAPLTDNLPVLFALAGIWNINFEKLGSLAVVPYDQRLETLPAFLQQLDMESNGKSVSISGEALTLTSAPVVFGLPGTNAQHTFHQWLHQGPRKAATEFIGVARPSHNLPSHHDKLISNMLAQSEALATGTTGEHDPHRACTGNRPSTTILLKTLDAKRLGMLIALYEHKIFVQGVIWNVNSFDQFGVELGKHLAADLLPKLETVTSSSESLNSSTAGLLGYYHDWRESIK